MAPNGCYQEGYASGPPGSPLPAYNDDYLPLAAPQTLSFRWAGSLLNEGSTRQSIETGAKQGLPEIALEAIFEQVGGAVCARGNRLLAEHDGNELAPVTRLSPNSPQPQGRVGVSFDGAHRVKKPLVALQIERRA